MAAGVIPAPYHAVPAAAPVQEAQPVLLRVDATVDARQGTKLVLKVRNLPALKGSERQIRWSKEIRNTALRAATIQLANDIKLNSGISLYDAQAHDTNFAVKLDELNARLAPLAEVLGRVIECGSWIASVKITSNGRPATAETITSMIKPEPEIDDECPF